MRDGVEQLILDMVALFRRNAPLKTGSLRYDKLVLFQGLSGLQDLSNAGSVRIHRVGIQRLMGDVAQQGGHGGFVRDQRQERDNIPAAVEKVQRNIQPV